MERRKELTERNNSTEGRFDKRTIVGFDTYEIFENGEIWSKRKKRFIYQEIHMGYLRAELFQKGKSYKKKVHRIVAEHFLENFLDKKEVNHKDGNKLNNAVSNLEWVTHKENIKHCINILKNHPCITNKLNRDKFRRG